MLDAETDFGLRWLFNPKSSEFLPLEDQLKRYKTQDLAKNKTYATATKLWGLSRHRKRVFIAPPMAEQPGREVPAHPAVHTARLKPLEKPPSPPARNSEDWALSEREKAAAHDREVAERAGEYKGWLEGRMRLRTELDGLGLSESWLRNKPDPSPLEQRVADRMMEERLKNQPAHKRGGKEAKTVRLEVLPGGPLRPSIKRPPPEALAVIAQYLAAKRQRLIDLFSRADKDKSWTLSRAEFQRCITQAGIPLSSQLLADLIESLDSDGNDLIDYREFVHGMKDFKSEERKKASVLAQKGTEKGASESHDEPGQSKRTASPGQQPQSHHADTRRPPSADSSVASCQSPTSSAPSPHLLPPMTDLTERRELEPDDMIEKRKRERLHATTKKEKGKGKIIGKVRTGNLALDRHSMQSTLGGDTATGIHHYREARLKEYHDICNLCKKNGINLTPQLLERALLHPGDKPVQRISSRIRQPGTHALSQHFADPPAPKEPPPRYHDPDKVVVGRSGELLMEAKHAYPQGHDIRPEPEMMNLSSGKAFVSRKVDCWMTFEEYDRLTSHLAKRYVILEGAGVDPNVFWPGQLLDKMRLCMPEQGRPRETDSLFTSSQRTGRRAYPGYNNDLKWWPISDSGHMMRADYEQNKVYSIDWK